MDQKRIEELKKICNETPNGPWYVRYTDDDSHMNMTVISTEPQPKHHDHRIYGGEPDTICIVMHQLLPVANDGGDRDEEIAAFIAESRMAVPEALAEIERLRAAIIASRDREARLIAVLAMANDAMNHMGDVLNGHDMAEPADVEKVTPAFDAVRAALSQSSAPASEPAAAKCSMCHGTGLWNQPYAVPAGVEPPSPKKTTCPSCKGNGRVAAAPKEPNHE